MSALKADSNERDAGVVDEIVGYVTSTPPRSFFLFAGAGSGKTRTLVAVLRKLTGIDAEESQGEPAPVADTPAVRFERELRAHAQTIRVITYTKNAALVITGRLGANDLTQVATIHSFCWDLIAGFDEDIREALLAMNEEALQKARDVAAGRKSGPTGRDKEKIGELEAKALALAATPQFTYSPDRKRHGDGALNHAQILALASWLLRYRPTLRRILYDQHPVIFIDESQDTMKGILDALLEVVAADPAKLMLGLFGDHRQRIYLDGHADLLSMIPEAWAMPKLEMNHRSQRRIVDLINEVWDSDLEGRTQSKKAIHQHPRKEKSEGLVRLFIGNASASAADKLRREALCELAMQAATGLTDWMPGNPGHKVLALEHSLVARRGDFLEVFEALSLLDPDSVRPDANGDVFGPTAVQMLLREVINLADCVGDGHTPSDFAVTEVLHRYGRLQQLPEDSEARMRLLKAYQQAVKDFVKVCVKPEATVREVLAPVLQGGLFEPDKRLVMAFNDKSSPPPAPKTRQSEEALENRLARGWHGLLESPWIQLRRFKTYLSGKSHLATHQVVKGSEFDHVMVVMDDEDAAGNLFAYDRLFGAPLGDSDVENVRSGKETSIDRTLRLLYVTCSRAKESLGLVLWAKDAAQALAYAQKSKWFKPGEVQAIPE